MSESRGLELPMQLDHPVEGIPNVRCRSFTNSDLPVGALGRHPQLLSRLSVAHHMLGSATGGTRQVRCRAGSTTTWNSMPCRVCAR